MEKNRKWKEKVVEMAIEIAVAAGGVASWWEVYQPEEPEEIMEVYQKYIKKK